MIRIRDISLPLGQDMNHLIRTAARRLHVADTEIGSVHIRKKSIDARKKQDIRILYTVDVTVHRDEQKVLRRVRNDKKITPAKLDGYQPPRPVRHEGLRPVVVGFGPGGMFAALILAEAGLKPIVLERGLDAVTRQQKVREFWQTGKLDPECNVQFGEGGAGTFSDGKLTTGIKSPYMCWILEQFHAAGARENILFDAKPHIGTDVLVTVVQNLRKKIESLGGEVRFGCKVTELVQDSGRLTGLVYAQNGETVRLDCDRAILAIGHSARDTFQMLLDNGVPMEPKAFSMGVRIEHPQSWLDRQQYGDAAGHPSLPPADYKLAAHLPNGDSAYTFCMCPGGHVVAAASEEGGVVTNGMSNADRDGQNCNAALLVTLHPADFPFPGTLGGVEWQRQLERQCYKAGGSNYRAPAQLVKDFLSGKASTGQASVRPSYAPGVTFTDLHSCLPEKITNVLEWALPELDKRLPGFANGDAVLTAPETRSSSPVRILRDETQQSALRGLFPCGEGAGYAGGITSAAVDGVRCAEALLQSL